MTVSYKDLQEELKRVNTELKDLSNKYFEEDSWRSNAELEVSTWSNNLVEAKVNWCALGEVEPEKAVAMAALLLKVAQAAEGFKYNGYTVTFS